MARQLPESDLRAIEKAVDAHPGGAAFGEIARAFSHLPNRTLRSRIKKLVDRGRLIRNVERRGARYFLPEEGDRQRNGPVLVDINKEYIKSVGYILLLKEGKNIRKIVTRPFFDLAALILANECITTWQVTAGIFSFGLTAI